MRIVLSRSLLILFAIFLIGSYFHPITEMTGDLGRHLLTGKLILQTHSVPKINLYSYTYPNFPFINHHWLSEAIFYVIQSVAGFNGLLFFTISVVLVAYLLPFIVKRPDPFTITSMSILYVGILTQRTLIRPEIFSYLYLSVILIILYSFRQKNTRLIFVVPLLELLWVNSHIYFPLGVLVVLFFLSESIIRKEYFIDKSKFKTLFVTFISTCLATLINPNGISGALYPLRVFNNYGYNVIENDNIFSLWSLFIIYHKYIIVYFILAIIFLAICLIISIYKIRLIDVCIILFFSLFALLALRNIPIFVFATIIPATVVVSNISRRYFLNNRLYPKLILVCLFIILVLQAVNYFQGSEFGLGAVKGGKDGVDFFVAKKLHGPIFNNFDAGNYLEYRLYPKERVFVDARPEAYPASFFTDIYIPMLSDNNIFEKVDSRYRFNVIFFAHADQTQAARTFLSYIVQNPNWVLIYLDEYTTLFVKNKAENKSIINKFTIQKTYYETPGGISHSFKALVSLANFYAKAGWEKQEEDAYYKILSMEPNFCPALHNLLIILMKRNDSSVPTYLSQYQKYCSSNL